MMSIDEQTAYFDWANDEGLDPHDDETERRWIQHCEAADEDAQVARAEARADWEAHL